MDVKSVVEAHLTERLGLVGNYIEKIYVDVTRVRFDFRDRRLRNWDKNSPSQMHDLYLVVQGDANPDIGIAVGQFARDEKGEHYDYLAVVVEKNGTYWTAEYRGYVFKDMDPSVRFTAQQLEDLMKTVPNHTIKLYRP